LHHKKTKTNGDSYFAVNSLVQHPVLSKYYAQVLSLREYILTQLPSSSRIRRKKVSAVGIAGKSPDLYVSEVERSLGILLDSTLIGLPEITANEEGPQPDESKNVSQRGDESYVTLSNGAIGFVESQSLVSKSCFPKEKTLDDKIHLVLALQTTN
jgi:telomerase reverse transcriptase